MFSIQVAIAVSHSDSETSTDVYEYCLKNNGRVKARPSDFEFAVQEISNNGEVTAELEELGILKYTEFLQLFGQLSIIRDLLDCKLKV